jgi:hypothetical protein
VVPEYGHNGHLRATHGFDERARLARLAVQRQVAGEQDEIRLARSIREHGGEPLVSGPPAWMSPPAATLITLELFP